MSQRTNAGFNAPGFSVCAGDEVAAAPGNLSVPCDGPPFGPSWLQGVGQPDIFAWQSRFETTSPIFAPFAIAFRFRSKCCSAVPPHVVAEGVAQPTTFTACSFNGRELRSCVAWLALPLRQSRVVGVAHPVKSRTLVTNRLFPAW